MSTIKVTPEQLLHVSRQIEQGRQQLEGIRNDLTARIGFIQSQWAGATQERFFYDFQQSRSVLDRALESMVKSSQDLMSIAERFEQADQEQVSLGAVAGQIAAHTMMNHDTGNPEEQRRMVYNPLFRVNMPASEAEDGMPGQKEFVKYWENGGSYEEMRAGPKQPESSGGDIYDEQISVFKEGHHPVTGESIPAWQAAVSIGGLQTAKLVLAFTGTYNKGYKVPNGGLRLPKDRKVTHGHLQSEILHDNPMVSKTNKGLEMEYANQAGNKIVWVEHNPKNITNAIEAAKHSRDTGKVVEGKVGEFVDRHVGVTGFGVEIKNAENKLRVTDLDVVTNSQIIEVKKSAGAVKTDQIDRLVDTNNKEFFNYKKKEVILYIDAPLENTGRIASEKIEYIKSKGVKVVNSLEELREVLK
ncbi:WXG100 family type VII secretion target [Paenibacillus polymyxa]|uniref:WXG100 family type VII secretion target n=1 Tax=Paenibacillus polymyxa TaxID=1406 RepID=UPI001BE5B489|nr:WXG100 family type VII secretion target [Paenibacillus polymyxa]MBT2287503.1 WXG100 family type VII secretion target [Paenibacillus polymyxa]